MKPKETLPNISTGVILAGGRSSRMGRPKALLTVNGKRMIDIILEVFHSLFNEIFIVTDDKNNFVEFKDVKIVEDSISGYGPLGGIYTGLKSISNDKAFFVACDMPFLHIGLIKRLLNISKENGCDCVVPYTSRSIEPLHAVYSSKILGKIEHLLKEKEFSLNQLLKRCNCEYIKVKKGEYLSFFNVNTPEDLKELNAYESKI
ncbi:MAG: molybdenum cofactor guanylyltransferase MobA [Candidatus Omnitrophica bacterium]|nr:molybdenum cofactor guanylyltransferase MobA [Candidatus Omnitrophota bacterium]